MKTKDFIKRVNSHIEQQVAALGHEQDEELKDELRSGIAAIVAKELTPQYVVRTLRRMLSAKLATLQGLGPTHQNNEPAARKE